MKKEKIKMYGQRGTITSRGVFYKCPECSRDEIWDIEIHQDYKFCPSCGIKLSQYKKTKLCLK